MTQLRAVRWFRDHPVAADAALAAGLATISLVVHLSVRDPQYNDPSLLGAALVLAATVPLAWRQRAPVAVLIAVLGFQFALDISDSLGTGWINMLVAAYAVGAHIGGRALWRIGGASTAAVIGFVTIGVISDEAPWGALISSTVLYVAALILGDNVRRRRERADELTDRAERAERERELLATQRVQQERSRIARELHDVVAHSVSVMIIQAGAARRQMATNPAQVTAVLESIEHTGREAMSEMRRMLGVLRSDDPNAMASDRSPQPTLLSLDDLVSSATDLPLALRTEGEIVGLPVGVELSAYRVVQEALTNVRRHAGRVDRVDVAVLNTDDSLVVEITDDGRGSIAAHSTGAMLNRSGAGGGAGYGLVGMHERVGLFGGSLSAGPRPGGGWRVRATFPLPQP